MRVLCIDQDAYPPIDGMDSNKITNGEIYEVVDVFFDEGYIWYVLSIDLGYGYWENCFARTSDIDESKREINIEVKNPELANE